MAEQKQRIDFIDLAKGICIILVVMLHAYGEVGGIVHYLRMPFYFTISGMFFKDYGGLLNLVVKKLNKLIIPFIFFYVLIWLFHWFFQYVKPGFWDYPGSFFGDLWNSSYMNVPVYFLLTLFWCNLYYYFIRKYVIEKYIPYVIACFAIIGNFLISNEVYCPFYVLTPFVAFPFFYIGSRLRTSKIITSERSWSQFGISVALMAVVWMLDIFSQDGVSFLQFTLTGNLLLYYIKSLLMVVAALLLCKCIRRLPLVSYCGRYSIIILGTHLIFCEISYHLPNWIGDSPYMQWYKFAFVLVCSICCIPVMKYLFPYFTAQKDIIN